MNTTSNISANAVSLSMAKASTDNNAPITAEAKASDMPPKAKTSRRPKASAQPDDEIKKLAEEIKADDAKLEEIKAEVTKGLKCVLPYIEAARVAVQRFELSPSIQNGGRMQDAKEKARRLFNEASGLIQSRYANTTWLSVVQDIIGLFQVFNSDILG